MNGIVYKQWYKPRNRKTSTPILNVKHLIYIATKAKECTFNKDCGFSLWGKLDSKTVQNIDNLEWAKKTVRDISKDRTVYRAILSLDEETANSKGYYDRESWQELTQRRMHIVAKELDINPENFQWVASYHHKQGHPHCHLMFWDKGSDIRKEHIPKERFEIFSEKVRSEFNRDIFAEELRSLRAEKGSTEKEMKAELDAMLADYLKLSEDSLTDIRTELFSMIPELAPSSAIEISAANDSDLQRLARHIMKIATLMPQTGSLNYQYLSPFVKKELDTLTDMLIGSPLLAEPFTKYMGISKDISRTYGNSKESIRFESDKSKAALYKDVGNMAVKFIREHGVKAYAVLGTEKAELAEVIQESIEHEIQSGENTSVQYALLLETLPIEAIISSSETDESFGSRLDAFTKAVVEQPEIKHYLDMSFAIRSSEAVAEWKAVQVEIAEDTTQTDEEKAAAKAERKALETAERKAISKAIAKEQYTAAFGIARQTVLDKLRAEAAPMVLIGESIEREVASSRRTAEQYKALTDVFLPDNLYSPEEQAETFSERLNAFTKAVVEQRDVKHYLDMNFTIRNSEAQAARLASQPVTRDNPDKTEEDKAADKAERKAISSAVAKEQYTAAFKAARQAVLDKLKGEIDPIPIILDSIEQEVRTNHNTAEQYKALLKVFPTHTTKASVYYTDEFKAKLDTFTRSVVETPEIKHYLDMSFAIRSSEAMSEWEVAQSKGTDPLAKTEEEKSADKAERKAIASAVAKELYTQAFKLAREAVLERMKEEMHWREQYQIQLGARLILNVCGLFRTAPAPKKGKDKVYSRDKSKAARKEREAGLEW